MAKPEFRINLEEEKRGLYQRFPLNLPATRLNGNRLRPSSRNILGKVKTFTRTSKNNRTQETVKLGSRFTYEQLKQEFGCSRATIALGLEELRSEGLIKKSDRDIKGTEYVYTGESTSGKFYIVPQYLYTLDVCVDGEYQRLTTTAVHVLAYLMTECAYVGNGGKPNYGGGVCCTSYKKLAEDLHFSKNAVKKAINTLMKANLVFRPAESKGKNGRKLSGYRVSAKLYILRKYAKKAATPEAEKVKREKYYKELRDESERRASVFLARAKKDKWFSEKYDAYRLKKTIEIAKAELHSPEMVTSIKKEIKELRTALESKLSKMGLCWSDITIQRNCPTCGDTGVHPSGQACTCYPGGNIDV